MASERSCLFYGASGPGAGVRLVAQPMSKCASVALIGASALWMLTYARVLA